MVRIGRIAGMLLAGALGCMAANTETVLKNFAFPPKGYSLGSGLTGGPAGELYGTTESGGPTNSGVVYRIDASGMTVLYYFTGGADGGFPEGHLARDSAGNLYGATLFGGQGDHGVVYMLDPTGKETVLYAFAGPLDRGGPESGVIRDEAGNLYGTTLSGGVYGDGMLFKIDPAGHETVLYSFNEKSGGGGPTGTLIRSSGGDFYGTTFGGGSAGWGTVFKVDAKGHETVLHNFRFARGGFPRSGVIRDAAGNFYGTTSVGGAGCAKQGCGVVFKLDPRGNYTVLYGFTGPGGQYPYSGVIRDEAGNLYGTASDGGALLGGVVYKVDPSGNETVLLNFPGGSRPVDGVIRDAAGNLYGTIPVGGRAGLGAVYKIDPSGVETVLHSFLGSRPGSYPTAGVIGDSTGALYGTTRFGGEDDVGVVYKLDAGGETVLYSFTGGADGGSPSSGVMRDSAGNLYGTTEFGGAAGFGVVFMVDPSRNETVLYSFQGGDDGAHPRGGVIRDAEGNLYGTTLDGGAAGLGCVFKLDASGNETILHMFTGGPDGSNPYGGVIRDQAGNLFGTATNGGGRSDAGVVFKVDGAGNETIVHQFGGPGDGAAPSSGLIMDAKGNLYGTTTAGGIGDSGAVYEVDAGGGERVLYSFLGIENGYRPGGGLTRDAAGNFYGTTIYGGTWDAGIVFMLSPAGQETVLYQFTDGVDGGLPLAGVIRDSAGNLFGTASSGGAKGWGVVFKVAGQ